MVSKAINQAKKVLASGKVRKLEVYTSAEAFGNKAEYPQVAIGLHHRGTLKETLKYMSDTKMFT